MTQQQSAPPGINRITVRGFKSIVDEQSIEIKPLTILAGANSSGKSSIMQPLLLMKQTLESPYSPKIFNLNGPNVKYSNFEQFISKDLSGASFSALQIAIKEKGTEVQFNYAFDSDKKFAVTSMTLRDGKNKAVLSPSQKDMSTLISFFPSMEQDQQNSNSLSVKPELFYFVIKLYGKDYDVKLSCPVLHKMNKQIKNLIHLPGVRGTSERTHNRADVDSGFPGVFNNYFPSVLVKWWEESPKKLEALNQLLERLKLTSIVEPRVIDDASLEIMVGRGLKAFDGNAKALVNIADVGVGVSQCLPILVALLTAQPDHLVYIEEPELHLHPKAQWELASIMAEAVNRGVRLVIETHSSIIVRGIQTLVARGDLALENVALHWFSLDEGGKTTVSSAELDENGAYGDWPEDFDDTALMVEEKYFEAVERRLLGG